MMKSGRLTRTGMNSFFPLSSLSFTRKHLIKICQRGKPGNCGFGGGGQFRTPGYSSENACDFSVPSATLSCCLCPQWCFMGGWAKDALV